MVPHSALALAAVAILCVAAQEAHAFEPNPSIQPESRMTLFSDGSVDIRQGSRYEAVRIWGTFVDDGRDRWDIIIYVRDPDGDRITIQFETRSTKFAIPHTIHGSDIRLEGWHSIEAYVNGTRPAHIGSGKFYVDLLGYELPAVRLDITNSSAYRECLPDCYKATIGKARNGEYRIDEGEAVEWNNYGLNMHHIYSQAVGYGKARPEIITEIGDGPNEFDGGLLKIGGHMQIIFDAPGTVLFTCLFHPWMEGLVVIDSVEGRNDGSDVSDRPSGVADILEEEDIREEQKIADGTAGPPGQDSHGTRLVATLTVGGDHGLLGGSILADIRISEPRRYTVDIIVQDDGGNEVASRRVKTNDGGNATATIVIQPTWEAGPYTVRAESHDVHGVGSASGSAEIMITGTSPCLGEVSPDTCFAGIATRTGRTGSVRIGDTTVMPAFIDRSGSLLDDSYSACMPGGAGKVVVADIDPAAGRDRGTPMGTLWCGGVMLNQALLDTGRATLDRAACGSEEAAERFRHICSPPKEEKGDGKQAGQPAASPPGGNCPMALLSYGTALAEPVQEMREARNAMIAEGHGWLFDAAHAAYYMVSPHAADILRENAGLRSAAAAYLSMPVILGAWLL